MILVDTNVLIDVLQDDPKWADWSIQQLRSQSQVHELVINPIIYAELSTVFESRAVLDGVIADMQLRLHELPRDALFLADKAFLRYKHSGGNKQNVLSDFFIGAHAAVSRCPVLTRDPGRYKTYFPSVGLVMP